MSRARGADSGASRWLGELAQLLSGRGDNLFEQTFEEVGRMSSAVHEQAAVLTLVKASPAEWHKTAVAIADVGSAVAIVERRVTLMHSVHKDLIEAMADRVNPEDLDRATELIARAADQNVKLITVLDEDYPANLHEIYNRPPFLWVRGELSPSDYRAIAIVGTRQASDTGRQQTGALAQALAREGVTVLSGLALGIDEAAHSGALSAGGRTVAVLGHGILTPLYPAANRALAERITQHGALISQFWPDAAPTRRTFPMRNVVTSGMSVGTVVMEAGPTSGAKMQARLALEHGKRLFLPEGLVRQQDWAKRYAERPGTTVVRHVQDILDVLVRLAQPASQLALSF